MSKRIPELVTLYPSFVPEYGDAILTYDTSADITKAATVANSSGTLFKALSANDTGGSNGTSAQPWFPTAGGVSVAASTSYFFEGILRLSRSAGTSSHTTSLLFAGTATLTSILYRAYVNTTDVVTNAAVNQTASEVATAVVVKAASTSATEQIEVHVVGIVRINAAGTFIPQFKYDVAPGGAPTVLANSFFKMTPIGSNAVTTAGTWA